MNKDIEVKLEGLEKETEDIKSKLSNSGQLAKEELMSLSQRYNEIISTVELWQRYKDVSLRITEDEKIIDSKDKELAEIAKEELGVLKQELAEKDATIIEKLVPKDPNDNRDVIMEIRQGTGGDEASIFAKDLFRMYSRFAERKKWRVEVMSSHTTEMGGFKEIVYGVKGKGAYKNLKYESGTHRVQRVPLTEASGRVHTSTATVAVLPEATPVDIKVNPNDIKFDAFRAGGHGGQNVNKVSSAVRLTYVPTGLVVVCQDERSQFQNKERAMKIMYAKLYSEKVRAEAEKIHTTRNAQIGGGDRSEKIRTYNYPQQRLTDHRINLSLYTLDKILDGDLDELLEALDNASKGTAAECSENSQKQ